MSETEYLLSSDSNAEHLQKSIEQLKSGSTFEHALIEDEEDSTEVE